MKYNSKNNIIAKEEVKKEKRKKGKKKKKLKKKITKTNTTLNQPIYKRVFKNNKNTEIIKLVKDLIQKIQNKKKNVQRERIWCSKKLWKRLAD